MDSKTASDQLNRILSFFSRVDGKASALFAIVSTMIGVLAAQVDPADIERHDVVISAALALVILVYSLAELFRCAFPRLGPDAKSDVYFKSIARQAQDAYTDRFCALDDDALLRDFAKQIWCNSTILQSKFVALNRSFLATMIAILPWAFAISFANWGG